MASQLHPEVWNNIIRFLTIPNADDVRNARRRGVRLRCVEQLALGLRVQTDLRNLCLTSHYIRSIATPHLYEAPMTLHPLLFVRTLLDHPDLAGLVKSLSNKLWSHWPDACPDDIDPRFVRLIKAHDQRTMQYLDAERARLEGAGVSMKPKTASQEDDGELHWHSCINDAAVFSLLPNLRDLGLLNSFVPVLRSLEPHSLPKLTVVKMHFDWQNVPLLSIRILDWLTVAVPNLRSLTLLSIAREREGVRLPEREFWGDRDDQTGLSSGVPESVPGNNIWSPLPRVPGPWFAGVTHLCLRRLLIPPSSLSSMLSAFPALENLHFDIEPRDGHPFSTRALEAGLVAHTPLLRRLRVDISRFTLTDTYDAGGMTWSGELASLTNLRVLVTTVKLLPQASRISGAKQRNALVSILPQSIEMLAFPEAERSFKALLPPLWELMDARRAGDFPALRKILYAVNNPDYPQTHKDTLKVAETYEEHGIEFEMGVHIPTMCSETGENVDCLQQFGI